MLQINSNATKLEKEALELYAIVKAENEGDLSRICCADCCDGMEKCEMCGFIYGYEKCKEILAVCTSSIHRKNKSLIAQNRRLRIINKNLEDDRIIRCRYIAKQSDKIFYLEDTLDRRTCFEILATILFTLFAMVVTRYC